MIESIATLVVGALSGFWLGQIRERRKLGSMVHAKQVEHGEIVMRTVVNTELSMTKFLAVFAVNDVAVSDKKDAITGYSSSLAELYYLRYTSGLYFSSKTTDVILDYYDSCSEVFDSVTASGTVTEDIQAGHLRRVALRQFIFNGLRSEIGLQELASDNKALIEGGRHQPWDLARIKKTLRLTR